MATSFIPVPLQSSLLLFVSHQSIYSIRFAWAGFDFFVVHISAAAAIRFADDDFWLIFVRYTNTLS